MGDLESWESADKCWFFRRVSGKPKKLQPKELVGCTNSFPGAGCRRGVNLAVLRGCLARIELSGVQGCLRLQSIGEKNPKIAYSVTGKELLHKILVLLYITLWQRWFSAR